MKRSDVIKDVDQMNAALFTRRITAFFFAYVVVVLNVKRRLGMFATPHQKNPVSGSDPKQGKAYNFVLIYLIEGMLDDGLKLCGVKLDVDDNFDTARKMLDARNESLEAML